MGRYLSDPFSLSVLVAVLRRVFRIDVIVKRLDRIIVLLENPIVEITEVPKRR